MKAAFLSDRGVVKVTGEDARGFLNGLVTTDTTQVRPGVGRFGALLTPQGKIIADFLITEAPGGHGGGFLLDCPRALAPQLAQRLTKLDPTVRERFATISVETYQRANANLGQAKRTDTPVRMTKSQ